MPAAGVDEATETLPREKLAVLQVNKQKAWMTELGGRNGFYTAKWKDAGVAPADIKSPDDLGKLPFTKKGELMDDEGAHGTLGRKPNLSHIKNKSCRQAI